MELDKIMVKRQILLVAGMHRSGTSALTRVLSLLGAALPSKLIPPMQGVNETGFWESSDLIDLHEFILESAGSFWYDWSEFNPHWYQTLIAQKVRKDILKQLERDFKNEALVVIKDPRICRFLPIWFDVATDFCAEPIVVIPIRHPLEVSQSLKKRDSMPISKGLLLWLRYTLDSVYFSQNKKAAFISYDDLMNCWPNVLESISRQTGVFFPKLSPAVAFEIDAYLDGRERHNQYKDDVLGDYDILGKWVKQTYFSLLELCKQPPEERDFSSLLDLRKEFTKVTALFSQVLWFEEQRYQGVQAELAREQLLKEEERLLKERAIAERHALENLISDERAKAKDLLYRASVSLKDKGNSDLFYNVELSNNIKRAALEALTQSRFARLNPNCIDISYRWPRKTHQKKIYDLIKDSSVFSISYYKEELARIANSENIEDYIIHYLHKGVFLGLDPHPLFSTTWYLEQNKDVAHAGINPLVHYLQYGAKELRSPHILFDAAWYLTHYSDLYEASTNPLTHYLQFGYNEDRWPNPLFDPVWYKSNYDLDVSESPLLNYITKGNKLGYSVNALFDVEYLSKQLPALPEIYSLLEVYIRYGLNWHLNPHPLFDTKFYLQQEGVVLDSGLTPLSHFIWYGADLDKSPCQLFDIKWYKLQYLENQQDNINPLVHYLADGSGKGLWPNSIFDPLWYRNQYINQISTNLDPLIDFILRGDSAGCNPNNWFDKSWYIQQDLVLFFSNQNSLCHYFEKGGELNLSTHPDLDLSNLINLEDFKKNQMTPLGYWLKYINKSS